MNEQSMTDRSNESGAAMRDQLGQIARVPSLLVAVDFDGTIAPIVPDPASAEADRESLVALKMLAEMPRTHVAIISGRALNDLAGRTTMLDNAHLVGSHGSEFEPGTVARLSPEAEKLLHGVTLFLEALAAQARGSQVEKKPAALAFHYRNVDATTAQAAVNALLAGPATWPGVYARHGKKVIELSVVETNKGVALDRLRQRVSATAVIYVGDDLTDEDVFRTLGGPDIGIKVGSGESYARFRAANSLEVAHILAFLAERRAEWVIGAAATPIDQHSLLSDQRTAALVDPAGRIVWLCLPRFDSPAVFAELLGGPAAGYFQVCAKGGAAAKQAYLGDTFILQSRWDGMTLTDYLDCGGGRAFQRAGRSDLIRVIEGRGHARITFAPRLDFGRAETKLRISEAGVEVEGAVDPLVLRAPGLQWRLETEGRHHSAIAEIELSGEPLVLELRFGTASMLPDPQPEPIRRERVAKFWSGWAGALQAPSRARQAVVRSALILKALTYGPTGAMVAAATTSLPETIGGVRNWDYRFCWPRDAALAARSLIQLGMTGPALRLLDWILGIVDHSQPGTFLCPVYTVTGAHLMPESEIAELAGYRGSRPVRVGNAASQQIQLDIFGPIADLIEQLARQGAALSAEHWRLIENMVEAVANRWREPDHGIWEVRRPRRRHFHSKVMCWQTVDRGLRVARYLGRSRPEWEGLRDAIRKDALENGVRGGRLCATYEEAEADASLLLTGLSGMVEPRSAEFLATIEDVERQLRAGLTVYRYRYDDGLPGQEGGFHICALWLVQALVAAGRRHAAEELFEDVLSLMGPTGMLSEEYEPSLKIALGNVPQAYSHLGIIDAAIMLSE